jgi:hypothetical protein
MLLHTHAAAAAVTERAAINWQSSFQQAQLEAKHMLHWLAGVRVLSCPAGGSRSGAVDIIRVSGSEAVKIAQRVFWPQVKPRQSMTAQPCYVASCSDWLASYGSNCRSIQRSLWKSWYCDGDFLYAPAAGFLS